MSGVAACNNQSSLVWGQDSERSENLSTELSMCCQGIQGLNLGLFQEGKEPVKDVEYTACPVSELLQKKEEFFRRIIEIIDRTIPGIDMTGIAKEVFEKEGEREVFFSEIKRRRTVEKTDPVSGWELIPKLPQVSSIGSFTEVDPPNVDWKDGLSETGTSCSLGSSSSSNGIKEGFSHDPALLERLQELGRKDNQL